MKTLRNHRLLEIGLALCVLAGVASGSFLGARHFIRGGAAEAQPPTEEEITERARQFIDATEAERNKPPFSGVFNGIRIVPPSPDDPASQPKTPCWYAREAGRENPQVLPIEATVGTPFEVSPSYLPPGAVEKLDLDEGEGPVVACDGKLSYSQRMWFFPDTTGGYVAITKIGGEHAVEGRASADRLQAITVRGKPAVAILPLTPDGEGPGGVIIAEDFGITVVGGVEFPIEVYIAVAEGLK